MKLSTSNLFQTWARLTDKQRGYFHALSEQKEAILFSLVAILRSDYFKAADQLFDMRLVATFAAKNNESLFTNLDALFIKVLNESQDYARLVESECVLGTGLEKAVSDVFMVNCFESTNIEDSWFSPGGEFLRKYLKWLDDRKFSYLTKEDLLARHEVYSGNWICGYEYHPEDLKVAKQIHTLLERSIRLFLIHYCQTSLERQFGLLIEKNLFTPFSMRRTDAIREEISFYYGTPKLNDLGQPVLNDRDLMSRIDYVRRKMAAYLVVSGFPAKLPKDKDLFVDEDHISNWLMNIAGVTTIKMATRLLETNRLEIDEPIPDRTNYSTALKDLAEHFLKNGISVDLEGRNDNWTLTLWWSASEDEKRFEPTTKVFSSGDWLDMETGMTGRIRDLI